MHTVDFVIHYGGDIGTDWKDVLDQLKAISKTNQDTTDEEIEVAKQNARDLGTAYIMPSNKHRYGKLIEDTSNTYLQGNDEYQKSVTDAYH